jgi:hypothetical protein
MFDFTRSFPMIIPVFKRYASALFAIEAGLLLFAPPAPAAIQRSVSQNGITWTFSSDNLVGQFCNGDWWVVGPVTITDITPASVNDGGWIKNGTQVNPPVSGSQGYDNRASYGNSGAPYSGSLNVSPNLTGQPLVLSEGSVVSAISKNTPGNRPQLQTAAILTVVRSRPEDGAFRPPPVGTDKRSPWNKNNLDYSILKSMGPVAGTPSLSTVEAYFARPWLEQDPNISGRFIHPASNQPDYGRDMGHRLAQGLLLLHLNYSNAEKETLFIRLVQYGIDIYGSAKAGGVWVDNGGHSMGRKMPMILAGLALDDPDILDYADAQDHRLFAEDRQTWYVTQEDVGRTLKPETNPDRPARETYLQSDVGTAEWGIQHTAQKSLDNRRWDAIYRDICYAPQMGHALAAHLTNGAVGAWNWPAFFDYQDRVFSLRGANANSENPNTIQPFVAAMWNAYRHTGGGGGGSPPPTPTPPPQNQAATPDITPAGGNFFGTVQVSISCDTSDATIYYTQDGSLPTSASTRYSGPITLNASAAIKAIAAKSGMSNSGVGEASLAVNSFSVTSDEWANVALPAQAGAFTVAFDATPSANNIDGVVGLSATASDWYTELAAIVRFSSTGAIDVRNGAVYQAENSLSYSGGVTYRVVVAVDLTSGTYSVMVTPQSGSPVIVAGSYAFRTEQQGVTSLANLAFTTLSDSLSIANMSIAGGAGPKADAPTISPQGFVSADPVAVSLTTATPGASIHYTLDGSSPTTASALYSAPIPLDASATVRAITAKTGMTNSDAASAVFEVGSIASASTWKNVAVASQEEVAIVTFDCVPLAYGIDCLTGISSGAADAYDDLAASVRFSQAGIIDARDGDTYRAVNVILYEPLKRYSVTMAIDLENHRYSAVVTPEGGTGVLIADNFAFRTEQAAIASFDNLAIYAFSGTHTVSAITASSGSQVSTAIPVFSPEGASQWAPLQIELDSATPGAAIYYTLDGTAPTTASNRYESPIHLTQSTAARAMAVAPGMGESGIATATFTVGETASSQAWSNFGFPGQTGTFFLGFDVVAPVAPMDGVTGLSLEAASKYSDLACIVRFAPSGVVDARNGGSYEAATPLFYLPGVRYHVAIQVNLPARRYSVVVIPENGSRVVIANRWSFRTEQSAASSLGNLAIYAYSGTHTVSNFRVNHDADRARFPGPPKGLTATPLPAP